MAQVATIGLDLAKNVFQVHGVAADGKVIIRRQVRRADVISLFASLPPCLVGMEACASAHHWAREIGALGHTVKLMPPAYVKPYVKRGKTDAADAEAIAEAVTRPTMRFVAVKTVDQPALLMLHKVRDCEIAPNPDPTLYWQQIIAIAMELRSREGSRLDAKRDPTGFDYSLTILMR